MTANPPPSPTPRPFAGLIWLILGLVWIGLVRVPLILNARAHLDSDLAVDGLTLLDATRGQWRWHYPATPFIGTPPVLLSYLPAKIWGTSPITLVAGGAVAWGLVVVATFGLNRRVFGPSVASWGLVPLVFASTGAIWLSGRITGGHLLTVAWHAGAFALLASALIRGGWRRAWFLGVWCGFGLYLDTMFAVSWGGLGVSAVVAWWAGNRVGFGRVLACLLAFGVGAGLGVAPRVIGQRVDPHNAYLGQFQPVWQPEILAKKANILALDCLPRLVAGHRLPWLQAEPDPSTLAGSSRSFLDKDERMPWLGLAVVIVALGVFGRELVALVVGKVPVVVDSGGPSRIADPDRTTIRAVGQGIRWGLAASSLAVVGGFLVMPNIENSDHYRYLVFLFVPMSTGFGLWLAGLAAPGRSRVWLAWALTLGFAGLMTADSAAWYSRFGWVDASYRPVRLEVRDPVLDWLEEHREVSAILGNYWDVYRLSFLTGGRVLPVPFPQFPDRFPEIGRERATGPSRVIIVRSDLFGPQYRARALGQGARVIDQGERFSIVEWPEGMRP